MQDYDILEKIGQGSFGNVLLVKEKTTDKQYALKKIIPSNEKPSNDSVNPLNEVDVLRSLDHINIIKYYKCFGHKEKLCILMEYADDGDLKKRVENAKMKNTSISEKNIINWFSQLCLAIKYIHDRNIIHRDIKIQNVFLMKNGLIKLGDFGISKILKSKNDLASTSVGTPYYYSPELCNSSSYSFKSDIWMLGCLLYELCALDKPFEGTSFPEIIQRITKEEPKPIPKSFSFFIKSLIVILLTKDQYKRPDINQIIALKEIKIEIQKIKLVHKDFIKSKANPNEFALNNYLDVKKKTMIKPVSFGNLPTYSTEYNEINNKKTMTPHFIPQEMLKDFEKNSILNLIQQINNSKKSQNKQCFLEASPSPQKIEIKLPEKSIYNNDSSPKQISLIIPSHNNHINLNNNVQISFENYLKQKMTENTDIKEDKPNIYFSYGEKSKNNEINKNENEKQEEIKETKNESCDFDKNKEKRDNKCINLENQETKNDEKNSNELLENLNNIERLDPFSGQKRVISSLSSEQSKQEEKEPCSLDPPIQQEFPKSPSPHKKHFPQTPESHFPNHRLKDLITSHMTSSLTKPIFQHSKKKVLFVLEDKDRGREKKKIGIINAPNKPSPKSASLNKRKTSDHIHYIDIDWFMEKISIDGNKPRSILMMDFLRQRGGKENHSFNQMKNINDRSCEGLENKLVDFK